MRCKQRPTSNSAKSAIDKAHHIYSLSSDGLFCSLAPGKPTAPDSAALAVCTASGRTPEAKKDKKVAQPPRSVGRKSTPCIIILLYLLDIANYFTAKSRINLLHTYTVYATIHIHS